VKGTSKVLLPAWSEDGTRIAFIERVKSDRYAVRLIAVE
jgi:Tol biopolymer transport system component